MSDTKPQIQEVQRTLNGILNAKQKEKETKPPYRDIMFKLQKIKEKERTQTEKNIYRGTKIRITYTLSEILQARRVD